MIRRMLTVASALSMLLCLAVGTLWAVAKHHPLAFEFAGPQGVVWEAAVRNGRLYLDTFPQYRVDSRPLADSWNHRVRLYRRLGRYQEMFTLRSEGRISRQAWEQFARDWRWQSQPIRDELLAISAWETAYRPTVRPPVVHSLRCRGVVGATAVLPLTWLSWMLIRRQGRKNRVRRNCCFVCGYDLRASANRCPECGTPISSRTEATA